jgi:hypothetical protein
MRQTYTHAHAHAETLADTCKGACKHIHAHTHTQENKTTTFKVFKQKYETCFMFLKASCLYFPATSDSELLADGYAHRPDDPQLVRVLEGAGAWD